MHQQSESGLHLRQELQLARDKVASLEAQVTQLTQRLEDSHQASTAMSQRLRGAVHTQREVCALAGAGLTIVALLGWWLAGACGGWGLKHWGCS